MPANKLKKLNINYLNITKNGDFKFVIASIAFHIALVLPLLLNLSSEKDLKPKKNITYFQIIDQAPTPATPIIKKISKVKKLEKVTLSKSELTSKVNRAKSKAISKKNNSSNSNSPIVVNKKFKDNVIVNNIPRYPSIAVRNGWQGKILISILVNSLGKVINVKVLNPSPFDILNRSALIAAKKWTFKPDENGQNFNIKKEVIFKIN